MFNVRKGNFNQPLNNWNVSNVTDMKEMFERAHSFNQPLNKWNVSNVEDMGWIGGRFTEGYKMQNSKKVTDVIVKFDYNMPWKSWDCDRTTHAYR